MQVSNNTKLLLTIISLKNLNVMSKMSLFPFANFLLVSRDFSWCDLAAHFIPTDTKNDWKTNIDRHAISHILTKTIQAVEDCE